MQTVSPWRSAARTDQGKIRGRNEDAFLDSPQQGLWVVADGMGGHQGGDIASQLIVHSLAELPVQKSFDDRLNGVRNCLRWINRRLAQELTVTDGCRDSIMGSTVVALLIEGSRAACLWAGDSRCYLWRGQRLFQLTRDHSLQQRLIDEQHMSLEQARAHPGAHALTRAVGASEQLTLALLELEVFQGDVFLLCSDGMYHGLSTIELSHALNLVKPQSALQCLFDGALQGPARDNLTAIVIGQ